MKMVIRKFHCETPLASAQAETNPGVLNECIALLSGEGRVSPIFEKINSRSNSLVTITVILSLACFACWDQLR